jgi:glycerol-3-phosphate dehydrogenase (NAD(P)+)
MGGVSVVGAGSWGTAVAAVLAHRAPTVLWARFARARGHQRRPTTTSRTSPGSRCRVDLRATADLAEVAADVAMVLVAVPSHGFRAVLEALAPHLGRRGHGEPHQGHRVVDKPTHVRGRRPGAAFEPGRACSPAPTSPARSPRASRRPAWSRSTTRRLAELAQDALHGATYRVYTSNDVVGCEIAGAVKNVIAVAAGMSDGLGFGENTRAALITRGLAELGRIGTALGGQPLTFGGLAGVGDLVATCTSPQEPEPKRRLCHRQGQPLAEVLSGMHMVAEGVRTAGPLVELARGVGIEMPIAEQVAAIVEGTTGPLDALVALMGRRARAEWDEDLLAGPAELSPLGQRSTARTPGRSRSRNPGARTTRRTPRSAGPAGRPAIPWRRPGGTPPSRPRSG